MIITYNPLYAHPLPSEHRFPMEKYFLLEGQLKMEGIGEDEHWICPQEVSDMDVLRVHDSDYFHRLNLGQLSSKEERASGFKWSQALIRREKIIMEGTRLCAVEAAKGGVALNIAGGTHHAFRDRPEGFCLLNDLVIAATHLLETQQSQQVLIVDLDVHQGNGTAEMVADNPDIYALSMHGAENYPFRKTHSDLDIALPTGTTDEAYLTALDHALDQAFEQAKPDVVLYQCGVDVLETDKLGKLKLSPEGCATRDRRVFEKCKRSDVGIACAMGGGYSPNISDIVSAHMRTFQLARALWT